MDLFKVQRREFLEYCRWVAVRIMRNKPYITIDDVRAEVPLPLNIDGRVYGGVFNSDEFVKVDSTATKRKTSHGRPVSVWRLKGGRQ